MTYRPIAEVALEKKMTREMVLRRIMRGELVGVQRDGRWFVVEDAPPGAAEAAPEVTAR